MDKIKINLELIIDHTDEDEESGTKEEIHVRLRWVGYDTLMNFTFSPYVPPSTPTAEQVFYSFKEMVKQVLGCVGQTHTDQATDMENIAVWESLSNRKEEKS